MQKTYYRVKIEWPAPYFLQPVLPDTFPEQAIYDARFYTTATELYQVHLDIQEHLVKNYAPEGLNEFDDQEDHRYKLSTEEVLKAYGNINQPVSQMIEAITDPMQTDLLERAITQADLIQNMSVFIASGFIPTQLGPNATLTRLGAQHHVLKRSIRGVLGWHSHQDDEFDILEHIVNEGDTILNGLMQHIGKLKE